MRKMKRFADGGSDKYKAKYDRKVADIESDYEKAKARKTGRAAEVAKAKYEQRMADAKDDLAKWTKSDRTETRAAEKAAERNLSLTRRFGSAEPKFEDKPLGSARPSDAELTKITSDASQKFSDSGSFKAAFAAARKDPSKPKTFTWRGTSYTTELASEKPRTAARSTGAAASGRAGTPTTNTRAATELARTAARSQQNVRDERAKNQADFRKRMQANRDGTTTTAGTAPRTAATYTPTLAEKRAAELRSMAAADRKLAADKKNYSGEAIAARLRGALGITSSRESSATAMEKQAQRKRWQDVEAQGAKDAQDYASAKKRADRIAAGSKPNATSTEKFYAKYPDAMKKGGKVAKKAAPTKKYAKGGKIDGCAVRGMTKAKRAR